MFIKREMRDDVCILSFNKPEKHNALDDEGLDEMLEAFTWAQQSKDFRVVLLRGEGRSFCSGADTSIIGNRKPGVTNYRHMTDSTRSIRVLLDLGKPLIAAVKGATLGAGAELALVCDFRLAAADLKFALPEVRYGLSVDQGGSALASSLIGPARTKYLLMTAARIDAQRAYEWGLVDFVVEPEALDATAFEMALSIARQPSQQAVLNAKELVHDLWAPQVRVAMNRELTAQLALLASAEFAAMREKRS
jgi:enoyl-CoA hydratase/carnithine racemase